MLRRDVRDICLVAWPVCDKDDAGAGEEISTAPGGVYRPQRPPQIAKNFCQ